MPVEFLSDLILDFQDCNKLRVITVSILITLISLRREFSILDFHQNCWNGNQKCFESPAGRNGTLADITRLNETGNFG